MSENTAGPTADPLLDTNAKEMFELGSRHLLWWLELVNEIRKEFGKAISNAADNPLELLTVIEKQSPTNKMRDEFILKFPDPVMRVRVILAIGFTLKCVSGTRPLMEIVTRSAAQIWPDTKACWEQSLATYQRRAAAGEKIFPNMEDDE